jgi:D-amino peptidase
MKNLVKICGAIVAIMGLTVSLASSDALAQAKKGYRIFISADMEGITAAVQPSQISAGGMEYQTYRKIMTMEVIAAIEGAKAAGATEFVVADSHGSMQNLMVELLPDDVEVVRGSPRPLSMMEGVQHGHFDGAIFIGYHASTNNVNGVRAHTISSANISELKLNGIVATEGYINAAVAGDYGVPIIMISGDEAATAEVKASVGDMETAVVKHSISFHAARTLTPKAGQNLIRAKAKAAVARLQDFKPFVLKGPITLDVMLHFYRPAELLSYLPNVERTGARSFRYVAPNMSEITKFTTFFTGYNISIRP